MDNEIVFELKGQKIKLIRKLEACYVNGQKVNEQILNQTLGIFLRAADEVTYMQVCNREKRNILLAKSPFIQIVKLGDFIEILYCKNITRISTIDLLKIRKSILAYFQMAYPINCDYSVFDPIYFSLFLYEKLPDLLFVQYDTAMLDSLYLLRDKAPAVPLTESESYKALCKGVPCKIYTPFPSNHVIDSDYQRLMASVESIKRFGYPCFNRYIILYNNEPYIRDGQHRAAILKHLYGNIKVPVMRLNFKGVSTDVYRESY